MALRNNASTTSTASFEGMDDDTPVTATAVASTGEVVAEQGEVVSSPAQASSKEATVAAVRQALSVSSANAVATSGLRTQTTLDNLKNVIEPDMLAGMGFNAFPRIVVAPGAFTDKGTGKSMGDTLDIEILSWNNLTLVTTGAKSEDKEATKLMRNSYDGVNLAGGEGRVDAYVAKLKAMDYDKASAKGYLEIYGFVLATSKGEVDADDRKLTQISVSPSSVGAWNVFLLEQRIRAAKGVEVSAKVRLTADSKSGNGNVWGVVAFKSI